MHFEVALISSERAGSYELNDQSVTGTGTDENVSTARQNAISRAGKAKDKKMKKENAIRDNELATGFHATLSFSYGNGDGQV